MNERDDTKTDIHDRFDRLESLVDRQAETIETLRETVARLEAGRSIGATRERSPVSRRTALKAGGLAGLIALGAGTASADPQGQIGTASDPLRSLYTGELNGGLTGGQAVTDLFGDGLALDGDALSVADPRTDVSGDGTTIVEDVTDVDFRDNLSVVDDGDGSVGVDVETDGLDADTLDGREGSDFWHPDNDGSGSGLDADTVDGRHASNLWHPGNDGPGSGLGADTVDGEHASAFAGSGHDHLEETWVSDNFGADGLRIEMPGGRSTALVGISDLGSATGIGVYGEGSEYGLYGNGNTTGIRGEGDAFGLYTGSDAQVEGDLLVFGNKAFVHAVETAGGEREVVYTSLEAPTPRTEVSGVARLDDGRVEVDLPEHFAWVTSADEPLIVQVTPQGDVDASPSVVERSRDRIVVADEAGAGYEVAWTVKGTRAGFEDAEVVREPTRVETDGE